MEFAVPLPKPAPKEKKPAPPVFLKKPSFVPKGPILPTATEPGETQFNKSNVYPFVTFTAQSSMINAVVPAAAELNMAAAPCKKTLNIFNIPLLGGVCVPIIKVVCSDEPHRTMFVKRVKFSV